MWKEFVINQAIQYPLFVQRLMIMIVTPCNTSDVERRVYIFRDGGNKEAECMETREHGDPLSFTCTKNTS